MTLRISLVFIMITFCIPVFKVQAQNEAEVIHWWVSGGEKAALQVIIDAFEKKGHTWIDTPVESSFHAKTSAISRILEGRPPTAIQWHAGVSLKDLYNEGVFNNINDLASSQGWQDILPEPIWNNISVDGNVIAVPITVHSSNWIWANKDILDKAGVKMPASWEELLQSAPKIADAGYYPLAIGQEPWQIRALFLPIVIGTGGIELYTRAFVKHEQEALLSDGIIKSLETLRALKKHIDPDSDKRNWSDTTRMVIDGRAAFQVMGDWVKSEFLNAGKVPGKDFLCTPSPGSNGTLTLVSDAFVMGNITDKKQREIQENLAITMMDKEVQTQFNLIKGSVPPRTDVSSERFDICTQIAISVISSGGTTVPGFNMANTGMIGSGIISAISDFWNTPEMAPEEAAKMLAEAVTSIKL